MKKINYTCTSCGVTGVKLWREYQTYAHETELLCADCGEKRYAKSHEGKKSPWAEGTGDQLGWFVPAVLTAEGDTFWGYTSVPQDRWEWWDALPPKQPEPTKG